MTLSKTAVGMAVRAARLAARMSLTELAEKTDLNVSGLSRIETGNRSLDFIEASAIADALNIDLEHLHSLASTFQADGLSDKVEEQSKRNKALRKIQQLAILTAIEASQEESV